MYSRYATTMFGRCLISCSALETRLRMLCVCLRGRPFCDLGSTHQKFRGDLIRPVAGLASSTLPLSPYTVAELLRAAGHFVGIAHDATPKEHEVRLQSSFMDFGLRRYSVERVPGDSPWAFVVSDGVDAEEVPRSSMRCLCEEYFSHGLFYVVFLACPQ